MENNMQVAPIIRAQRPRRTVTRDATCDVQSRAAAFELAKEVSQSLPLKFPRFVKSLCPSHVSSCFCFGVPKEFCDKCMPKKDEMIILVGEDNQEFKVKFLFNKAGFGSGWTRFAKNHNLRQGDSLVFQLIEQWKLRVYIVRRTNAPNENDVAPAL